MSEPPSLSRFIDLHTHTTASDGTLTPIELVALAKSRNLDALGITDHDTFAGFDEAAPIAQESALDLVCGIELNSRLNSARGKGYVTAHLLAYWPISEPPMEFRTWLQSEREDRRDRNRRLVEALRKKGIEITIEEIESRGRHLAGRAHFARILIEKGYARNQDDAFHRYLAESAPTYVERRSRTTEEAIARVRSSGGIPVIAHPVRLSIRPDRERAVFMRLKEAGLLGMEVYHSEHTPELQAHYGRLSKGLGLLPTGGSDFHGLAKPDVELGTGIDRNVRVPRQFLDRMRSAVT